LLPLFWPTTRAFCADGPVRSSAPPIRTNRPCPPWPTTTCCWAVSSAPPVSVRAPPLSTTTASPVRPWAVICPVSVVVPETSSSPAAPSPATVEVPAPNEATLVPPGGAGGEVLGEANQLAATSKAPSPPFQVSVAPTALLCTLIVAAAVTGMLP